MKSTKLKTDIYVQYGCGMSAPEGWLNFDASPNLFLERLPIIGLFYTGEKYIGGHPTKIRFPSNIRFGNITKGLPLEDESVKGVYASHVLEHLSLSDFKIALKNTFDLLESGGVFRLIVPDLKQLVNSYVNSSDAQASMEFVKQTGMGTSMRTSGLKGVIQSLLGNGQHLWMWDYNSMRLELEKVGFTDIRRAFFNDSEDPIFRSVEDQDRFKDAVAIQCKKPLHNDFQLLNQAHGKSTINH